MNNLQKAGGLAALYVAVSYLAAMPYFLFVVDLGGITDPLQKVLALIAHRSGLYAMELVVYVFFGLFLTVLAAALHERLKDGAQAIMKVATPLGFIWAGLLIASGMIYNVGMDPVITLHGKDPTAAAALWTAVDLVSSGLSGNGEVLGGSWMLLLSVAALKSKALPRALSVVGLVASAVGIAAVIPALKDLAMLFGLGQILWALWLGVVLLRGRLPGARGSAVAPVGQA